MQIYYLKQSSENAIENKIFIENKMFMEIRGTERMKNITKEEMNIKEFFEKYPNVAIALSGGVDSVFLVYMAKKYAKSVKAYLSNLFFNRNLKKRMQKKFAVS